MQVKRDQDATIVRFSATEVASAGLPAKPAYVSYRAGLLDDFSCWLIKQCGFEPGIDKLIALADRLVYH